MVDSDQSEACLDDLEALWVGGWDGMVIIGHTSSRSTFDAN